MSEFITLFIPFAGTTLGAAMVFFMKDKISPLVEKALLGFAAGVMIAASIWSLLIPSIDMAFFLRKIEECFINSCDFVLLTINITSA